MKNRKLETKTYTKDVFLWSAIVLGLALIIGVSYHFAQQLLIIRLVIWIISLLVIAALFFCTTQGRHFAAFLQAARAELYKVVWPNQQETVRTTLLVIGMVLLAGLFLWAIDSFLLWLVALLTR